MAWTLTSQQSIDEVSVARCGCAVQVFPNYTAHALCALYNTVNYNCI